MVWLVEDSVHQVHLFQAPIWCPSGGGSTRKAGGIVAESLVGRRTTQALRGTLYRVSKHQVWWGGGQIDRRRARGVLNPCAPESKAQRGEFLRDKLISNRGLFSFYESQQGAANGRDFWGVCPGCTGLRAAGC